MEGLRHSHEFLFLSHKLTCTNQNRHDTFIYIYIYIYRCIEVAYFPIQDNRHRFGVEFLGP